jgi:hypothetical protein
LLLITAHQASGSTCNGFLLQIWEYASGGGAKLNMGQFAVAMRLVALAQVCAQQLAKQQQAAASPSIVLRMPCHLWCTVSTSNLYLCTERRHPELLGCHSRTSEAAAPSSCYVEPC